MESEANPMLGDSTRLLREWGGTNEAQIHSLEVAMNAMPVGISWANLTDQKIIYMNRTFTEMFGYRLGEIETIPEWIEQTYPFQEDRELAWTRWGAYFNNPHRFEFPIEEMEIRVQCRDGSIKTVLHSGVILPQTGWALATFFDITERKRNEIRIANAEHKARENEAIYRLLLEHSTEMIVLSALDRSWRFVSPGVTRITGFTAEEYLALEYLEWVHPDDRASAHALVQALATGKTAVTYRYRALQKDGSYRWVESEVSSYQDPLSEKAAGYVATIRDISEEKRREEEMEAENRRLVHAASLDELTGIANRRTFNQIFRKEALRQTRSTREIALLMIDVDYFKRYNDTYGHIQGDKCLRRIARIIATVLRRDADLVARFGGEEFVVLLPVTTVSGAEQVAQSILDAINSLRIPHTESPFGIVTVSIGVASWPPGEPLQEMKLLDQADRALYLAKSGGRNQVCCFREENPQFASDPS